MRTIVSVQKHMVRHYVKKKGGTVDDNASHLAEQEDFKKGYFAFTSLKYRPQDGLLYCGNTNFGNDLLRTFDPQSGGFKSLGYQAFGEEFSTALRPRYRA